MLVTIKKPTFEPEARNSADNLETRYERFMKWKDSDVDFTKNCVFTDEAGFHINLRTLLVYNILHQTASSLIPRKCLSKYLSN